MLIYVSTLFIEFINYYITNYTKLSTIINNNKLLLIKFNNMFIIY